jgi:mannosyltransferase PIG-V
MVRRERFWPRLTSGGGGAAVSEVAQAAPIAEAIGRRSSLLLAAQVFVANRVVLIVISLLTGTLFYDIPGSDRTLLGLWHRWDVKWYVFVADHGYRWHPPPIQSDLAFFPLYPLCMHILTLLSPLSTYGAGLLITSLSFAAALYLLHRLVVHDFGPEVAERTLYYLGLFPTALFFFTAYPEALYLACCLGCVYALRLRRWWIAGLCGMAAALTRQLGLLLVVPFAIEYLESRQLERPVSLRSLARLGPIVLVPAGTLAFMIYLQIAQGNALLFLRAQEAWGRTLAPPWQGMLTDINHIMHPITYLPMHTQVAEHTLALLDLSFLALFLALLVIGVRYLPRSYTAYTLTVWLTILINPAIGPRQPLALLSVSRFGLVLFPPFIVLGLLGRRRAVDRFLLALFVALLSLFTIVFVRGRWIA